MTNSTNKYPLTIRILHWFIALLILATFSSGFIMSDLDNKKAILKGFLANFHKSFGAIVLVFIIFRVIVRLLSTTPKYDNNISNLTIIIAKVTHMLLYVLMLAVPLSGLCMTLLGGRSLSVFGIAVPIDIGVNKEIAGKLYEAHKILPYFLIGLVGLHIAATIKHMVINKDNIFNRISISCCSKKNK